MTSPTSAGRLKVGRLKIVTLVGTRPEVIKLSRVVALLEHHTEHVLVHSGQNYDYELNEIFFEDLEMRSPDHYLEAVGLNAAKTIALVIARFDKVLELEKPDAVLVYGDTNTCMGVIAAKRRKIPIFHMEAGNRCFDQRVPEELNRKVVDHLSDVNMTNSEHARRYLLAEGLRPDLVVKTGSPMREVLGFARERILASDALRSLGLPRHDYVLVSAHREETVDVPEKLADLVDSLLAIGEGYGKPIVVSTHPRTRQRLEALAIDVKGESLGVDIRFMKPFGFIDYVNLQMNAFCVVSDSGTLIEEASILDFPAVMIREAHERPEGTDDGVIIFSGLKRSRVLQAIDVVASEDRADRKRRTVADYEADDVSRVVLHTIISYVDYVKRVVWKECI